MVFSSSSRSKNGFHQPQKRLFLTLQDGPRQRSPVAMYFTPFLLGLGVGILLALLACELRGWNDPRGQGEVEVLLQVAPAPRLFVPPLDKSSNLLDSKPLIINSNNNSKSKSASPKQNSPFHTIRKSEPKHSIVRVVNGCPDRPLHLAILILSAPSSVRRRAAIRGTWAHDYRSRIVQATTKFLVGTHNLAEDKVDAIAKEEDMYGDVLILDSLQDSYANLSTKVLLGLKWASTNLKFDYLVKVDDDSYVRIEGLADGLRKLDCDPRLYWGYFMGHAFPETVGKWAEGKWFHCPHYLPYAMGGGYVLSQRVVGLLTKFSHRLILYNNEDVTVASWLAPYRLSRKHDIRFDVESLSHGCNNGYLISHKERVKTFYTKYTNLVKNSTLCAEEKEIRPAYIYNWTGSPLDCCQRHKGLPVT